VPDTRAALLALGRAAGLDALDARLLLLAAAGLRHDELVSDPRLVVAPPEAATFRRMLARRLAGEPVARILGEREFYGRPFLLTPDVLDPRPDTETVVALSLEAFADGGHFLDLGVGSGAIAVTLAAERPASTGMAVDLSEAALTVARTNAERFGVARRLDLRQSDWFARVEGTFDFIVSNPPYIAGSTIGTLAPEVRDHDPRLALDGGADGLQAYRQIAAGCRDHLRPGGKVVVEIGAGQDAGVRDIFAAGGLTLREARPDLGGHLRALIFAVR
jgi:release factor glutamine methyltransferase